MEAFMGAVSRSAVTSEDAIKCEAMYAAGTRHVTVCKVAEPTKDSAQRSLQHLCSRFKVCRGRHYSTLCQAPELVFREGSALSRLVRARCPALLQPYCPTFWATNAHAQTVLCGALACAAQRSWCNHLAAG